MCLTKCCGQCDDPRTDPYPIKDGATYTSIGATPAKLSEQFCEAAESALRKAEQTYDGAYVAQYVAAACSAADKFLLLRAYGE